MANALLRTLKQRKPFASPAEEAFMGLQVAAQRLLDPWELYLKSHAGISAAQYNVLRILRGAVPDSLTIGGVAERLISRLPDVTRLIGRLAQRGLVCRERDESDRRVVRVRITSAGLDLLEELDDSVDPMLGRILGHLGEPRLRHLNLILDALIEGLERGRGVALDRDKKKATGRHEGGSDA
jgi:DNA-binding MarR family transcriptional regulator